MKATDYLRFIVREIHTTVVATVDEQGLPVTCAIDIMDSDENGLYFLTAKGKSFYERLNAQISAEEICEGYFITDKCIGCKL